jgi:hypothetical protein
LNDLSRRIKTPGERAKDSVEAQKGASILKVVNNDPTVTRGDSLMSGMFPDSVMFPKPYDPSAALADSSAAMMLRGDVAGAQALKVPPRERPKTAAQVLRERVRATEDQAKLDYYETDEGKELLSSGKPVSGSGKGKKKFRSPTEAGAGFIKKIADLRTIMQGRAPTTPGQAKDQAKLIKNNQTPFPENTPEGKRIQNMISAYTDSLGMSDYALGTFGDDVDFNDAVATMDLAKRLRGIKSPVERGVAIQKEAGGDPVLSQLLTRMVADPNFPKF